MQAQLVPGQDWLNKPTDFEFQVLSRLQPDIPMAQAAAQTDSMVRQFASTYVTHDRTLSVALERTSF